jgi:hypothetical protein
MGQALCDSRLGAGKGGVSLPCIVRKYPSLPLHFQSHPSPWATVCTHLLVVILIKQPTFINIIEFSQAFL